MKTLIGWIVGALLIVLSISGCGDRNQDFSVSTMDKAPAADPSIDAKALFQRCVKCHGKLGKKQALGTSRVIAGQPKEVLMKKIEGYQKGIYGGSLKGVMSPQAQGLTPAQINALAEYISKLR